MEVTYNRRLWNNFFLTHNRALTAADYDEVTLIAPQNPSSPMEAGTRHVPHTEHPKRPWRHRLVLHDQ